MESTLQVLIVLGLIATSAILGVGVVSMFRGGEFNRRHSNKLMRMRVGAQAVTLLLLLAAFLFLSK